MSGPTSIRHKSEGWGFESTSGRGIFRLKNFDTFTQKNPFVQQKRMLLPQAQFTLQMLTLLNKLFIIPLKFGNW